MAEHRSILEQYPDYECVIGIEVHVQLITKSKIFCRCANEVSKEPNSNICQICAGYPGVLPVLNEHVVRNAVLAGLATNCQIMQCSEFARKHYFYPDLPKDYQITQNDKPICTEGYLTISTQDGSQKNIRLIRIHMEEDAGKNIHVSHSNESFVDLNRAGTPLLEMVSYPDIANAFEAKEYLKSLRRIVQYLGICTGNMEEGAFRADTNISVRKKGETRFGTRVELKNINSFKFISDAIEYEIERQIELLESGQKVRQETRLWDTQKKQTFVMRVKEEAADYRYFPDPDLPLVELTTQAIHDIKATMPELPDQKLERLCKQYGLSEYEADILIEETAIANYFEKTYEIKQSKLVINWILRDIMALLKDQKITIAQCKITPDKLAQLIDLIEKGTINNRAAQEVFAVVAQTGEYPAAVVKAKGLEQIGSSEELETIIKELVATHPDLVADYKAGKQKMFGFFVGEAMKKTQGKGNPKIIQDLLKKYLS